MNTRDFKTFGIMLELHVGTRGAIFGVPCPEQPVVFGCVERPPVVDRSGARRRDWRRYCAEARPSVDLERTG